MVLMANLIAMILLTLVLYKIRRAAISAEESLESAREGR
jgi:hypothetical protein